MSLKGYEWLKDNKVIINRKITQKSDTTNLKLLDVNGDMAATTIYEGGTALSSKYLGINTKEVVKTSGNQEVGGDKTFNGQTTIDNLILTLIILIKLWLYQTLILKVQIIR